MLEYIFKIICIPIGELYKLKRKEIEPNDNFDIIQVVEDSINLYNFNITTREKLNMFSKGYQQMKEYFEK
jgi:hypothetical protein